MTGLSAERMAKNETVFRDANEQIEARADELEFSEPIPFLCECGDAQCQAIVRLSSDVYAEVRSESNRFFVSTGHEAVAGSSGRVIDRRDGYVIVDKVGTAGVIAAQRDPRQHDG